MGDRQVRAGQVAGYGFFERIYECPYCEAPNDCFAGDGPKPQSGNVIICARCSEIGIFTDSDIRLPTPIEAMLFETDDEVQAKRRFVAALFGPR